MSSSRCYGSDCYVTEQGQNLYLRPNHVVFGIKRKEIERGIQIYTSFTHRSDSVRENCQKRFSDYTYKIKLSETAAQNKQTE